MMVMIMGDINEDNMDGSDKNDTDDNDNIHYDNDNRANTFNYYIKIQ